MVKLSWYERRKLEKEGGLPRLPRALAHSEEVAEGLHADECPDGGLHAPLGQAQLLLVK